MDSLQNLCYASIADSIQKAPPQLQELLIGETTKRIRKNIRKEVKNEIEQKIKQDLLDKMFNLVYIVPEIMEDINESMTTHNRPRRDFYKEYPTMDKNILDCAIRIAEQSVYFLENNYTQRAFAINQHGSNYHYLTAYDGNDISDADFMEEESQSNDYLDYIDYP